MSIRVPPDHHQPHHHLNLITGAESGFVDPTTLAAYDFDVDTRTGFMPPEPPISRLPTEWEPWEMILDQALSMKLQPAVKASLTEVDMDRSASWRERVKKDLSMLSTIDLADSQRLLRRAHHVLTFISHFYIHTVPLKDEIRIPRSISIPLLEVAQRLHVPPVATYSDTVLYNWCLCSPDESTAAMPPPPPALEDLRSLDLFTGTKDEEEFYLASARIEIRGAEALELMRSTMDEMFIGDNLAVQRITGYLTRLATVVTDLTHILLDVRKGCDPDVFYHSVRPWFCGEDSDPMKRRWIFEGLEERQDLERPTELSGASAGQSTLIHSLDIFLGLDDAECDVPDRNHGDGIKRRGDRRALLRRMQLYMPRRHRSFLHNLIASPRRVRSLVIGGRDRKLVEAYDDAVNAVKGFRDAHLRIVALFIVGPANRARSRDTVNVSTETRVHAELAVAGEKRSPPLTGTGGTDLMQFLKGVRDQTAEAVIGAESRL